MTRTAEANAAERATYRNDNPNPRMRPGVDSIISQLRKLKIFDGHPDAVETVADDLIHHYFVFREPHPQHIWNILQRVHSYWLQTLGQGYSYDEAEQLAFHGIQVSAPNAFAEDAVPDSQSLPWDTWAGVIRRHQYDPYMRKDINVPRCTCGKEFEFYEQHAEHVARLMRKKLDGTPGKDR